MHYDSNVLEDSNRLQSMVQNSCLLPRHRSHVKFFAAVSMSRLQTELCCLPNLLCPCFCTHVCMCVCALCIRAFACEMSRARKRMKSPEKKKKGGGQRDRALYTHIHKHTLSVCVHEAASVHSHVFI